MDDATPGTRACSACGGPIRSDNTAGICSRTAECRAAYARDLRERHPEMNAARVRHRRLGPAIPCEICGTAMRSNNSVGICTTNPVCVKLNDEAHRRARGVSAKRPIKIKVGDIFGCWTILEDYAPSPQGLIQCRCACGREWSRQVDSLIRGDSRSCGCPIGKAALEQTKLAKAMAHPYVRAGERFGLLVALEDGPFAKTVVAYRCDCGRVKHATAGNLRRNMNSCGHTRGAALSASKRTHGLSKHPLYGTWYNMVNRCYNPANPSYVRWGGRGLRVYGPWRKTPAEFITWIEANLGPRPEGLTESGRPLYTLDRWPDNDGNYEPGNVRWATRAQQTANRRTVDGVTRQRDTALAEVERLNEILASMSRKRGKPELNEVARDALF